MGKIHRLYTNSKKPFQRLWNWADKKSGQRFKRLARWSKGNKQDAKEKAEKADSRKKKKFYKERATFWAKKQTIYRKEHKKSKKDNKFRPYMLNGKSGRITKKVEDIIAVGVLKYNLVVTSTSDGYPGDGVHTNSSNHYWQNSPIKKGEAVDMAGAYSNMSNFHSSTRNNPGKYEEQFGPGNFYIKYGNVQAGQFPGHTDHTHTTPS